MNVTAVISLDNQTAASVPTEAIVNDKGQDFIFIMQNNNDKEGNIEKVKSGREGDNKKMLKKKEISFEKIPVAKGVTDLGYTQITPLKPMPPNAKIVTKNAFFILAKLNNKGEEGHGD